MKKTILALSVLLFAQAGFAYIVEGTTADVSKLQNSGYSQAVLKIMDKSQEQVQTDGSLSDVRFVRYYKDYKPKNGLAAFYNKAKIYWDPIAEDSYFGKHEADFSNAWFYDLHDSSVDLNPNRSIESL